MSNMNPIKTAIAALILFTSFIIAGCGSDPQAPPPDKRDPKNDITAAERKDKKGDVPVPGMQAGK